MKVSIFDPSVGAYREIELDDYKVQLESLGLDDKQVEEMVKVKVDEIKAKAAELLGE